MGSLVLRIYLGTLFALFFGFLIAWIQQESYYTEQQEAFHREIAEHVYHDLKQRLTGLPEEEREAGLTAWNSRHIHHVSLTRSGDLDAETREILARERHTTVSEIGLLYERFLVHFLEEDGTVWTVEYDERHQDQAARFAMSLIFWILLLSGLVYIILVYPIAGRMQRLTHMAIAFGQGQLAARIKPGGPRMVARLGEALNRMAADLERKIQEQQVMTYALSHELSTPLTRMRLALDLARIQPTPDPRTIKDLDLDLKEMEQLCDDILNWARLAHGNEQVPMETTDLMPLITRVCEELVTVRPEITLTTRCDKTAFCHGNARQLRQAIANLIRNGQRHATHEVTVAVSDEAHDLVVVIDDDGPGIPEEARDKVLMPFSSLEKSRTTSGSGLGLAIVNQIVRGHQGCIAIEDSPKGGARIRLTLPKTRTS